MELFSMGDSGGGFEIWIFIAKMQPIVLSEYQHTVLFYYFKTWKIPIVIKHYDIHIPNVFIINIIFLNS